MDDNWTRGVNENDVVGTGAGLCARYLFDPRYCQTNQVYPFDDRYRAQWFTPSTDLPRVLAWVFVGAGGRFPYGFPLEPSH